jgi:hypothetical protein
MRVQLFGTCLVDAFFLEVGEATLRLLRHFGAPELLRDDPVLAGKAAGNGWGCAMRRRRHAGGLDGADKFKGKLSTPGPPSPPA